MEVAAPQPTPSTDLVTNTMDIDMDIDLGPFPEGEAIEMDHVNHQAFAPEFTAENGVVDPQTAEAHYEKVHIRGVDELTTDNIKQFALNYFSDEEPSRIEWIDDMSANIVYSSDEVGLRALTALTQLGEEDISALPALRLRTAKTCLSHPESVLQVRSAVKTDRKKPRAHESSRFYLMHPEHDPRERLRRELAEKRRQGGRRDEGDGDYRRIRFDEREHRRRRNKTDDGFNASMYDDDGADPNRRRASSDDFSESEGRRRPRRERRQPQELFPERGGSGGSGRLRDRSASPGRDDLDAMRRSDDEQQQVRRRFRERSPRFSSESHAKNNKELFPEKDSQDTRELFPNRTAASYLKKELFLNKTNSNHRRTDAFDAADETADLFSRRISMPLIDGGHDEIYIKGASNDQGMALRGLAGGRGNTQTVKELFPDKYNANAGKELFSNKLEGRGGRRRRAEDMFQ
ncbi:conserved hypothetical protein [Talaromyces stipitatus ATCC 10500]|uniref:Nuclear cap-binding protein subunit 3 n=1 Tax=Talaromyces stipitatus (strain ATCC 10500 / CBS 375.48 / QM 6759 / NRRL 1006) TaxID=441959 RepID=B8MHF1_TALSN|nr:uncharacterized protein TSTA_021870 [Talaromyces stipitatus ATCC 10500]EED17130.1 conserved hypothetical protein [Talaromyces stipitatus ATCC 10500]